MAVVFRFLPYLWHSMGDVRIRSYTGSHKAFAVAGLRPGRPAPDSLGAEMDLVSQVTGSSRSTVGSSATISTSVFQTAGETELVLEVRKKSGEDWKVELERAEGEDFLVTRVSGN